LARSLKRTGSPPIDAFTEINRGVGPSLTWIDAVPFPPVVLVAVSVFVAVKVPPPSGNDQSI
jgi:hypothetical protein